MKNKIISFVVCISFILSSNFVHAIEPLMLDLPSVLLPDDEADPGAAISPLRKGNRAPFTGVHLSPAAVATLLAHYKFLAEQIEIETKRAKEEAYAKYGFEKEQLRIQFEADKNILKTRLVYSESEIDRISRLLRKEIDSRPSIPVWVGIGFASGAALVLLTIFVSGQSTN
jgi:hypothetical protein